MEENKKTSIFDFTKSSSASKTILWSGLVAGVLDAIAGVIVYYIFFDLLLLVYTGLKL